MPRGSPRTVTSIRLDPRAVALLDAWGRHRHATGRSSDASRGEVIEAMLHRLTPPDDPNPTAAEVRRAYKEFHP